MNTNFQRTAKEQHLFEMEIFCNIINVITVTFEINKKNINYQNI